jgi:hypothetical protein
MATFDDLKLEWGGNTYVVPARQMLEAIARIEDVITLHELHTYLQTRNTAPIGRVARAYASVLRCAGAQVTDDEAYRYMFGNGTEALERTQNLVTLLQAILLPPEVRIRLEEQASRARAVAVGEQSYSGNLQAAPGKAWSKPGSRPWSDQGGSHPKHSGPGRRSRSNGSSKRKRRRK